MSKFYKYLLLGCFSALSCSFNAVAEDSDFSQLAVDDPELTSWFRDTFPRSKASDAEVQEIFSPARVAKINELENCVAESEYFAGLDIRYEPKHQVIAKFTRKPRKELRKCTNDPLFRAVGASRTLDSLESAREGLTKAITDDVELAFIGTDIRRNRVVVDVGREDFAATKKAIKTFQKQNRKFKNLFKVRVSEGLEFSLTANIGGAELATAPTGGFCSTAFSVTYQEPVPGIPPFIPPSSNTVGGVMSAGHCPDTLVVNGSTQTIPTISGNKQEAFDSDTDLQLMAGAGDDYFPQLNGASLNLPYNPFVIEAVSPTIGERLCNVGHGPGTVFETCGIYEGVKSVVVAGTNRTAAVNEFAFPLSVGGDSGGPVYRRTLLLPTGFPDPRLYVSAVGVTSASASNPSTGQFFVYHTLVDQFSQLSSAQVLTGRDF